jgi:hypothetical protein
VLCDDAIHSEGDKFLQLYMGLDVQGKAR